MVDKPGNDNDDDKTQCHNRNTENPSLTEKQKRIEQRRFDISAWNIDYPSFGNQQSYTARNIHHTEGYYHRGDFTKGYQYAVHQTYEQAYKQSNDYRKYDIDVVNQSVPARIADKQ